MNDFFRIFSLLCSVCSLFSLLRQKRAQLDSGFGLRPQPMPKRLTERAHFYRGRALRLRSSCAAEKRSALESRATDKAATTKRSWINARASSALRPPAARRRSPRRLPPAGQMACPADVSAHVGNGSVERSREHLSRRAFRGTRKGEVTLSSVTVKRWNQIEIKLARNVCEEDGLDGASVERNICRRDCSLIICSVAFLVRAHLSSLFKMAPA